MTGDDMSFAQLPGRIVVRVPGPRIDHHESLLGLVRTQLDNAGFPKSVAHLDVPRELTDALFNPASENFPTRNALHLLLKTSDVAPARRHELLRHWDVAVEAYRQQRHSLPPDFANMVDTIRRRQTSTALASATPAPIDPPTPRAEIQVPRQTVRRRTTTTTRRQPLPVLPDAEGFEDLQPDPLLATTVPDFLQIMRHFHVWSGEESFRELSRIAHGAFGASTISETLSLANTTRLPSLRVVTAFVQACGGSDHDLIRWTTAWRVIRLSQTGNSKARSPRLRAVDAS
jgi:hypothetical protein